MVEEHLIAACPVYLLDLRVLSLNSCIDLSAAATSGYGPGPGPRVTTSSPNLGTADRINTILVTPRPQFDTNEDRRRIQGIDYDMHPLDPNNYPDIKQSPTTYKYSPYTPSPVDKTTLYYVTDLRTFLQNLPSTTPYDLTTPAYIPGYPDSREKDGPRVMESSPCGPTGHRCDEGYCIERYKVCNGIRDCVDSGSDEINCGRLENKDE